MDATEYLKKVEEEAKRMYAISDQGRWEDLPTALQRMWIDAADRELRPQVTGDAPT